MSDFTIISTVRHGQTAYNIEKRYAGTIDVPLNENGINDAIEGAKKLKGAHFDVVISSALKRAIQTAQNLLGEDIPIVQSNLCNERNYGKMEGRTEDEVKFIKPKIEYFEAGNDYHSLNPPGGETFEQLRERAEKFYNFIFENYKGFNVFVSSHGVFLQQFHGVLRGKSWGEALETNVRNLEFTTFKFKGLDLVSEESIILVKRKQSSW